MKKNRKRLIRQIAEATAKTNVKCELVRQKPITISKCVKVIPDYIFNSGDIKEYENRLLIEAGRELGESMAENGFISVNKITDNWYGEAMHIYTYSAKIVG